ncbi:MAG: site-specific DNA-methyltransferase, partial [Microcystis sp.]
TDTWEGGMDSFLDMIYPRLQLMKRLLTNQGSIYIHFDFHVSHYVKILLDEVFGIDNLVNEIIWKRSYGHGDSKKSMGCSHDVIFLYSRSEEMTLNPFFHEHSQEYIENFFKHKDNRGVYKLENLTSPNPRPNLKYSYKGYPSPDKGWRVSAIKMEELDKDDRLYFPKKEDGRIMKKVYLDELEGQPMTDLWTDIKPISAQHKERQDYPTQKPESLLERIIKASSNEGDLVADFFCGSGTTMAVADRLNRRWIGCNLDKVGIQVSRNRMVNQQSQPFLLENIGNYQRHMIYLSGSKIGEMQRIILNLY